MNVQRFLIVSLFEIVTQLVQRLGYLDLYARCLECKLEYDRLEREEKEEG